LNGVLHNFEKYFKKNISVYFFSTYYFYFHFIFYFSPMYWRVWLYYYYELFIVNISIRGL